MRSITKISDGCTEHDTCTVLSLQDSISVDDVSLEHKLRYEYAKLQAKDRLRSKPVRYALVSQHESAKATSLGHELTSGLIRELAHFNHYGREASEVAS